LVVQDDSIGGHIHIITSLGTTHGFLCRRHFLANVLCVQKLLLVTLISMLAL
jgi:hypothetical protein